MNALVAVLFIVAGETLSIFAEFVAANRQFVLGTQVLQQYSVPIGLVTCGGLLLLAGYTFGYHAVRNIWVVSAASIGAILIVEPVLALLMFAQLPTKGAAIGFCFGVLGLLATAFVH